MTLLNTLKVCLPFDHTTMFAMHDTSPYLSVCQCAVLYACVCEYQGRWCFSWLGTIQATCRSKGKCAHTAHSTVWDRTCAVRLLVTSLLGVELISSRSRRAAGKSVAKPWMSSPIAPRTADAYRRCWTSWGDAPCGQAKDHSQVLCLLHKTPAVWCVFAALLTAMASLRA